MMNRRFVGLACSATFLAGTLAWVSVQGVTAAEQDITGVVTGANGPEAGVWVIAETADLPTGFRKIVVTDDEGRFLVPELPPADYEVWVRGYGLRDSAKSEAKPGGDVRIRVQPAATPLEAADIYPSNYWYSLLRLPESNQFPGTGSDGNGISANMRTQAHWIDRLKDGCQLCHQIGNKATRELPALDLNDFASTRAAWQHRIQSSGSGPTMVAEAGRIGSDQLVELYAEWTDQIRAGQVPPAPPRPSGQERNVVLTMWGWATPHSSIHDEVATDKRNPNLYPNGPVYGVGGSGLVTLDPVNHRVDQLNLTVREESPQGGPRRGPRVPSLYWGTERGNTVGRNAHNPMMDGDGRLWITQSVRPGTDNPTWCKEGSTHPSAAYFPLARNTTARQLSFFDTKTQQMSFIDTCYATHHLQFDTKDVLWVSGSTEVVGWLDKIIYDATGDEQKTIRQDIAHSDLAEFEVTRVVNRHFLDAELVVVEVFGAHRGARCRAVLRAIRQDALDHDARVAEIILPALQRAVQDPGVLTPVVRRREDVPAPLAVEQNTHVDRAVAEAILDTADPIRIVIAQNPANRIKLRQAAGTQK
jgi:hypothetical protein